MGLPTLESQECNCALTNIGSATRSHLDHSVLPSSHQQVPLRPKAA